MHIWGPASPTRSLADRIANYLSPPLFPVHLSEVPSRPAFHDVPDEPWSIGDAVVTGYPVSHIRADGRASASRASGRVAGLHPRPRAALGIDLRDHRARVDLRAHRLARGADILLHDAQYSEVGVRHPRGMGPLERRPRRRLRQGRRGRPAWCSSTTTRRTPTPTSRCCAGEAAAQWTGAGAPVLASDDMTIDLTPEGVAFATAEDPERPLLLA